jgi:NADH-quinone oxidoreductase subunit H
MPAGVEARLARLEKLAAVPKPLANALAPLPAMVCTCAVASVNRAPFDLAEAESELVAGFHTEYSGFRYALFMIAEYVSMITVSVVATTCFFGGWGGPFGVFNDLGDAMGGWARVILGTGWVAFGVFFFFFIFIWVRATIPRLRYDQLMKFSWSWLIPLGLVNLAITALAIVLFDS